MADTRMKIGCGAAQRHHRRVSLRKTACMVREPQS